MEEDDNLNPTGPGTENKVYKLSMGGRVVYFSETGKKKYEELANSFSTARGQDEFFNLIARQKTSADEPLTGPQVLSLYNQARIEDYLTLGEGEKFYFYPTASEIALKIYNSYIQGGEQNKAKEFVGQLRYISTTTMRGNAPSSPLLPSDVKEAQDNVEGRRLVLRK